MPNAVADHNPLDVADDDPTEAEELEEFQRLRQQCHRFRILIMGKANAGKTTILEKLCQSTEDPIVHDREGKKIDPSVLKKASRERGMHDIDHEITYASNEGFVFHDSRGFETGSLDEIALVRNIIKSRAEGRDLKSQLHAIWYCLPTDDDRPLNESELAFFHEGTYGVPVVAIFTKFDAQKLKAITKLEREGLSKSEARKQASGRMNEICPILENRLSGTKHPRATHVYLKDMHKQDSDCTSLIEKTASAMTSDILRHLLVTVQRNNLKIVIRYCIEDSFKKFQEQPATYLMGSSKNIWRQVYKWFPHLWYPARADYYYDDPADARYYRDRYRYDFPAYADPRDDPDFPAADAIFQPKFDIAFGVRNKCAVLAGLIIIAEHSFWMKHSSVQKHIEEASQLYKNSNSNSGVNLEIRQKAITFDSNGVNVLTEIVFANLILKPVTSL